MGALPSLRAATDPDAKGGEYYGPDGIKSVWGHPTQVKIAAQANDEATDGESSTVSLATWRTQTGQDAQSLAATPAALFVSATDLHLSATSPARNAGRASLGSVSAPTVDAEGAARPKGATRV